MPISLPRLAMAFALLYAASAHAQLPTLHVAVTGAKPGAGVIEVTVFDSGESFMKEAFLQQSGPVGEDGTFRAEFAGLAEGEYAVVVVHDENDNGKLDTGFLGLGSEPYAFSNGAMPWFGWPDFEDTKFRVKGSVEIHIPLD